MLLRHQVVLFGIAVFGVCPVVAGQPQLHLRSRSIETASVHTARSLATAASISPARVHLLAAIEDGNKLDVAALTARGIRILGYIPHNGVVISADTNTDFASTGLVWIGSIQSTDRLSADLSSPQTQQPGYSVVEFFSDVPMTDARGLVLSEFIAVQENPYLLPTQLLVFATSDQLATLAGNDMVEFIFPASDELVSGAPISACAGPVTAAGKPACGLPKF